LNAWFEVIPLCYPPVDVCVAFFSFASIFFSRPVGILNLGQSKFEQKLESK
jgi:hypothetical protein